MGRLVFELHFNCSLESQKYIFEIQYLRENRHFWNLTLGYYRNRLHISSYSNNIQNQDILVCLFMKWNKFDLNFFIFSRINTGLLRDNIELLVPTFAILWDSKFEFKRNSRSINYIKFFSLFELIRNSLKVYYLFGELKLWCLNVTSYCQA